jgi:hypothetical protein
MYTAYYGDQLLFDPRDQDRQLYDQECEITLNEACSYTFSMPSTHPLAGRLTVMDRNNEVVLLSNDEVVFRGRVVSEETDFYGCPTYTCEGERAYLNDIPAEKFWTYNDKDDGTTPEGVQVSPDLEDVFRYLVSAYNGRAERAFAEGVNQGAAIYPGTVNIQNTSRESVWETIKSECVDAYGGYVRVRYDGGTAYIDYLAGGDHVCGQVVSFGNNLLDYVRTRDGSDICTRIIPVGQTVEVSHQEQKYDDDGNPEYDDDGNPEYETVVDVEAGQDVYITGYPDNPLSAGYSKVGDHVVWGEGEKTYGIIEKYVSHSDLCEPADLVSAALADLQKCVLGDTIDLSALDLSLLDATADRLTPGDYVRVTSEPHGLDCYLVCTAAKLHPDAPDTDTYTLGLSRDELTQVQADRISQLNSTITLVEQVTTTGVQQAAASASSASAVAMKAQAQATAATKTAGQAVTTANQAALDASAAMESAQSSADEAKAAKADAEAVKAEAAKVAEDAAAAAEAAEKAGQQAVTAASVEYATSTSQTAAPTDGWSTSQPSHVSGEYTWVRTVFTTGAGASTTSEAALITGEDGRQGEDGKQGASVASVTTFWRLATSQPDTPSGTADPAGWSTTAPEPAEGYTGSLWVTYRSVISDGTTATATYTEPARDSSYAYAQRCWALEDGTYTTAAKLKQATDEVSSTLKADYSTSADIAKTYATQSDLTQTASSITSSVAETYQPKGDYATNDGVATTLKEYSTVTQTAEAVTTELVSVVGGRNLLLGTSVPLTPTGNGGTNQTGGMYYFACGKYAKLEPSTTYTFAFTAKASAATTGTILWQLSASPWAGFSKSTSLTTTATRHAYTLTTPASSTSSAPAVMVRMDNVPTSVTLTISDVILAKGTADPGWSPSPQDTSTLIRQSGGGVEVARKVNGSYVGTRAVLDNDSLDFMSQDGKTTYASFGTDGLHYVDNRASMTANDITLTTGDQSKTTVLGVKLTAPYLMLNSTAHNVNLWSSSTDSSGVTHSATLGVGANSGYYLPDDKTVFASTVSGTDKVDVTIRGGTYTVFAASGTSGTTFKVYNTGIQGTGIARGYGTKTLVSSTVTAYRHMGMVTVRLDNYTTDKITAAGSYSVGTLPAGWCPPARVKAPLYCDPWANLFFYVETGGTVKVYAPDKVASTVQMSGTVTFIATS